MLDTLHVFNLKLGPLKQVQQDTECLDQSLINRQKHFDVYPVAVV